MQQARPGSLPQIIVNEPASSEEWWCGHSFPVRWTNKSGDNSFLVNVELLKGDATLTTLGIGIPVSQGNCNCQIPETLAPGPHRIHVASTPDGKVFGTSDVFSIIKPGIKALPITPLVYNFYKSTMNPLNDSILLAWTYTGKIGSQISITWVPAAAINQQATSFIVISDWPIGSNGQGKFLWDDIMRSSNLYIVLKGQPEKKLFGYVVIKVIGTKFSAKSQEFTMVMNE
jgi:hypothetical protein